MNDPTDSRDLCAVLARDLESWVNGYIATDDAGVHFVRSADAIAESRGIVSRARAALAAEPQQEAPTPAPVAVDEQLPGPTEWVWHCYAGVRFWEYGIHRNGQFFIGCGPESQPATHWLPGHGITSDDWRQACLLSGRYCEPFLGAHPAPVPVAERLPDRADCDSKGRVWWLIQNASKPIPTWALGTYRINKSEWAQTHWLPYWALPLHQEPQP